MVKNKCECNWGAGLLALILMAIGVYFVVWGFVSQTTSSLSWNSFNLNALLYYLIGFVVLLLGKMTKCKSCAQCKVHAKH